MNHKANLAGSDSHCCDSGFVKDAIDDLNFEEMVPRTERATLVVAAIQRTIRDVVRRGLIEAAASLCVIEVLLGGQLAIQQASWTSGHQIAKFFAVEFVFASATDARRDVRK